MIKRLKWNVLYGGGDGDESDGGLTSSSEEISDDEDIVARQADANKVLHELVERDPELAETLRQKLSALAPSSSDEEEEDGDEDRHGREEQASGRGGDEDATAKTIAEREKGDDIEENVGDISDDQVMDEGADRDAVGEEEEEDPDQKYAEWYECDLCPGKRFLTDKEVEGHLSSKKHRRVLAKYNKRMQREAAALESTRTPDAPLREEKQTHASDALDEEENQTDDTERATKKEEGIKEDVTKRVASNAVSGDGSMKSEHEERKKAKRKAAAKRKLKALKLRKWEKKMATDKIRAEGGVAKSGAAYDSRRGVKNQERGKFESHANPEKAGESGHTEESASKKKKKRRQRARCDTKAGMPELRETEDTLLPVGKASIENPSASREKSRDPGDTEIVAGDIFASRKSVAKKRRKGDDSLATRKRKKVKKEKNAHKKNEGNRTYRSKLMEVEDETLAHHADEGAMGAAKSTEKKRRKQERSEKKSMSLPSSEDSHKVAD